MNIQIRPYQKDFIDAVRDQFTSGHKRVVGVAPCGAGKTIMTGWMIRESLNKNKRSIFFVHRKELIAQTAKTFYELEIPFGIITANMPMRLDYPVQIASVQTLARRVVDKNGQPNYQVVDALAPDFLICDECHHILAKTYQKILDTFPNAYLLGVTATPQRMGGVTLSDAFDRMVESLSVNQLTTLGNLTKFEYVTADTTGVDLSDVKTVHGDYDNRALEGVMGKPKVIGNTVKAYRQYADGKQAICYCVNVSHSMAVAQAFRDAGIAAAHCDGELPANVRDAIVDDFRSGRTKVLCNAELFGEGFDVPRCQAVILARPTKSLTLFIQQAMRPLRPDPDDPNKVAVIIDQVRNYQLHGYPNAYHNWSLYPNPEKKYQCPCCLTHVIKCDDHDLDHCRELQERYRKNHAGERIVADVDIKKFIDGDEKFAGYKYCPRCGYIFPKKEAPKAGGKNINHLVGDFKTVHVDFSTSNEPSKPVIKENPLSLSSLKAFADKKGFKIGYVAKRAQQFARSRSDCDKIAEFCGYKPGYGYYLWEEIKDDTELIKANRNVNFDFS